VGTVVDGAVPGVTLSDYVVGGDFTLARGSDGHTYAWGMNVEGQLGAGITANRSSQPVRVQAPDGVTFTSVAAGSGFAVAQGSDHRTYAWGSATFGQLGEGSSGFQAHSAVPVEVDTPDGVTFTSLAAGSGHAVALGSDGRAYAWGSDGSGQLGTGSASGAPGTGAFSAVPLAVDTPAGETFTAVTAGAAHTVALTADGDTYAWGYNLHGQVGDGTDDVYVSRPSRVSTPSGVTFTTVTAGPGRHTVAVGSDHRVYAWGENAEGQLGTTTLAAWSRVPVAVDVPAGVTFTAPGAGKDYTLASGSDGRTYAWGNNEHGQLGAALSHADSSQQPVPVAAPAGVTLTTSAGGQHALAVGSDGTTYAWGWNDYGQLGDGTDVDADAPKAVSWPAVVTEVLFGGVPGTQLSQSGGTWQVTTPALCGTVDVEVRYTQFGVTTGVTHPDGFSFGTAPVVTDDPDPALLPSGGRVTLAAAATGDDTPTVRWQQNASSGWQDLPGATDANLDVASPGEYRAVFTNCVGDVTTQSALVEAAPVDLGASSVVAAPDRIPAGRASTVTVTLVDTLGAPMPGQPVALGVDDAAVASVGAVTEGAAGTYTAQLTGLAPGDVEVGVRVGGVEAAGVTATVHVDPAVVDLGASSVVAAPDRVAVGEDSTVTVTLVDTLGAPVPGQRVALAVDDAAVASVGAVTEGAVTEGAAGTYTAQLTGLAPGDVEVGVSVDGVAAAGVTTTVHVDPAVVDPPDPTPDPTPSPLPGGPDGGAGPDAGGDPAAGGDPGPGGLAVTGANPLVALLAALLLAGGGTALVARRHRGTA